MADERNSGKAPSELPKQPMAEIFGFPITNDSEEALCIQTNRLCPFHNRVPSCTKSSATDPIGVCSIYHNGQVTITCPVRFRQDYVILSDAASFLLPGNHAWTSLTEVRLHDKHGKSAGNIDMVLVSYDEDGEIVDFGALEVQSVYISGNIRKPFKAYMSNPQENRNLDWTNERRNRPRADFLSSSRKRLAPQLIYKGGILHGWGKKLAVAVDQAFFDTLPELTEVAPEEAEMIWLVYQLDYDSSQDVYKLALSRTVYTRFEPALDRITTAEPGPIESFTGKLQEKLDAKRAQAPETGEPIQLFEDAGADEKESVVVDEDGQ